MAVTVPLPAETETHPAPSTAAKRWFLVLSVARTVLAIVAVPLAAGLYKRHVAVLVLLRPTKEVLLFAGFKIWRGELSAVVAVLAAIPLLLPGVWVTFGLGRCYADAIADPKASDLPKVVARLIPAKKVQTMQALLESHGLWVVFLGRLAVFPSSVMSAAAGAAGISWRRFLAADASGALLSLAVLLGLGYQLGDAYEDAGPWVSGAGLLVVVVLVVVLGRALQRGVRKPTAG